MKERAPDPDRVELKEKRGTWLRYIKVFLKCRLPWIWIIVYMAFDLGTVDIGVTETDYTARLFSGDTAAKTVTILILLILVRLLASSAVVFFRQIASGRMTQNMRGVLMGKLMRLPMSFFKDENPRDGVYRVVNSANVVESTVIFFVLPVITAAYTAVKVFSKVFQYDWRLSAVMLAFVPIQILIAFLFGRISYSISVKSADLDSGLIQRLSEIIVNIPLAKAFAREKKETERAQELTGRIYRLNVKSSWLSQLHDLSNTAVDLASSVVITLTGLLLLRDGSINTRGWISFFMFSGTFSGAVAEFMIYWGNVKNIQGSAEKLCEIMDAPEEDLSGQPCEGLTGDLELRSVDFSYDEAHPVLTGASCVFTDNRVTALLGRSGCGKTTIANLLTRLYAPLGGEITVGGNDISKFALNDYRDQFVVVSQNGMLFSGTVRENVAYGNPGVSDEDIERALRRAGAYEFVMALPGGLDARVEEYGGNFSGGQRQRLTVARALLSPAHYMILDEPAASMDAIAAAELMDVLREAARDRCMIIIAHTAAILDLADRVVVVEDGAVSAQGDPAEAAKKSRFLREFVNGGVTA